MSHWNFWIYLLCGCQNKIYTIMYYSMYNTCNSKLLNKPTCNYSYYCIYMNVLWFKVTSKIFANNNFYSFWIKKNIVVSMLKSMLIKITMHIAIFFKNQNCWNIKKNHTVFFLITDKILRSARNIIILYIIIS